MRVLFIYPSIDCPAGINDGLASMSGFLKARGHETSLIHVCEHLWEIPTTEQILDRIARYRPGIIGFSAMSQQYDWSRETARAIRERFPGIPLVVGGVHCTMVPDEVERDPEWDYIGIGECDIAFVELVERIEQGKSADDTPNFRVRRNGRVVARNPVGPFPALEPSPPRDYELFDLDHIIRRKKGWMGFITSRGCPYKCTYCFNKEIVDQYLADGAIKYSKEYLRHYDIDRMLGEIRTIKRDHPHTTTLIFDDDLFTLNKKYVLEFCEAYQRSGINLPFVVNAHVNQFNDEVARALKEAGCLIVKYGLESGSERIRRDVLWRYMPNEKIKVAFDSAHKYDLHTSAFVMFGLPHETKEEIQETIDLCAEVQMGRFRWAIFFPFPGTAGYTIAKDADLIDYEKMKVMGNYFDGSCLRFGPEMDLYIEKLGALFNWWVNSRSDWPCRKIYADLVKKVEAMDRETWRARKPELLSYDRELSSELMAKDITHYTIRYAHVMGVRSDFVKWEETAMAAATGGSKNVTYTLD
jgi:radical SAM superfamily enzyme YgiQ (UPF0313 family)